MIESTVLRIDGYSEGATASADAFPLPGGEIEESDFSFALPGSRTTLWVSDIGRTTEADDTPASTPIHGGLDGGFNFAISLFSGTDPVSGGTSSAGALEIIDPADPIAGQGRLDSLTAMSLDGATLTLLRGDRNDPVSSYATVAVLGSAGLEYRATRKTINTRELGWLLATPLHDIRFAGTGGYEGDGSFANIIRPIVFGQVFNIAPPQIVATLLIYQVSCTPVQAVSAVRDGGVPLTPGSDYATYALLAAATVAAGTYATCLALGLFRLGGAPERTITADVQGDNASIGGAGYVNTRAAIARRIAIGRGPQKFTTSQLDAASFTTLDAAQPGICGWYFDGEITKADALREIMQGCLGWAYVGLDGLLTVGYFTAPSSTPDLVLVVPGSDADTADADGDILDLDMQEYAPPRQGTYLGWGRNYTVQQQSDLAGAVTQANATIYGMDTRKTAAVDSALSANWPTSRIVTTPSGFAALADSQTETSRIQALLGSPLKRWKAKTSLPWRTPVLGLTAEVRGYGRFGFGASKNFRVVGAAAERSGLLTLDLIG